MLSFYRPVVVSAVRTSATRRIPKQKTIVEQSGGRWCLSSSRLSTSSSTTTAATTATSKSAATTTTTSSLLSFPKDHPFVFQLIVATTKTSAADLVVQVVTEGKTSFSEIDWRRNGIFVVFGFAYLGGFQWYLMVHKYRQWFPTMDKFAKMSLLDKMKYPAGILDACKMVLFDVVVHLPMLYFPTYYTVKEFVGGHSWNPIDWITMGCNKYYNNMREDIISCTKLWLPSDCIQFILPMHIRMPFRHLVSFFWTAYVSFTRGNIEPDDEKDE